MGRALFGSGNSVKVAYVKYILALCLFGSNGVVASHIALTSYEIVLTRTLIGSLLLMAIFLLSRQTLTCWQHKQQFFFLSISGMAMGASWMFLYEAYQQIGVSMASLAYYCGPVLVMGLAPVLFREKLTKNKIACFLAVLFGIILVNSQAFQEGEMGWGLFCGGMSAVMYALMVVFNKKATNIIGLENALLQLFVSFLTGFFFVYVRKGWGIYIESGDWVPIFVLGLINTGVGCYFYFSSISHLPVQTVAICGYLEPLSAVLFSVLLLQETMRPVQALGACLILGGAVWGECAESKIEK